MRIPALSGLWRILSVPVLLSLVLISCQAPPQPPVASESVQQPAETLPEHPEDEAAFREELRQQLLVADLLYAGLRALAADHLMTPAENSALSLFNRVLVMQPDNSVALQGIQDIATRYIQLADTSARQGQFDNARLFLQRAQIVYPEHEGVAAAEQRLDMERRRTHSVQTISGRDINARSAELITRLGEIAVQARDINAFVMITAPNDAQGRWIYSQMQDALDGFRLRADIEIGEQPSIRLVLAQAAE